MTVQEAIKGFDLLQEKLSAYGHAMSLIQFDGNTGAPRGTAANRAHTLGIISEEIYRLATGEETVTLLEALDAHGSELDGASQRKLFLMLKDLRRLQKIPMEEYIAYQKLLVKSEDVWHKAKETNAFALFEPYLAQIVETTRRFASYAAPEMDPYDYQLNEFEEGLDRAACDAFFAALREKLVPLIRRVGAAPAVDDACLCGSFPAAKQEGLARELMKLIGLDESRVGLAATEHPYTITLGSHFDVRITTRYDEENVASSLYSVVHEGGHALYESGVSDEYAYTVLDGGTSMGIHESQSRFYENIIGRSQPFVCLLLPKLKEIFPEAFADVTPEELWRAVNKAQPSLIRTEADELTYALHIMVRYELEKKLMAGELAVHDLPAAWNTAYKEYLGIDVPDDTHGVLQDSHWAGGAIGYFPSYALGSAYGAQFLAKMKESVDVDACLAAADLAPINAWLRENIWQHGQRYGARELLERVLGAPFDPAYYTDYLEKKFMAVYRLL